MDDHDGKKIYTEGSDMYQLGKEECQVMSSWGEIMQQERRAAVKVLEDICKKGCEHCCKIGTRL